MIIERLAGIIWLEYRCFVFCSTDTPIRDLYAKINKAIEQEERSNKISHREGDMGGCKDNTLHHFSHDGNKNGPSNVEEDDDDDDDDDEEEEEEDDDEDEDEEDDDETEDDDDEEEEDEDDEDEENDVDDNVDEGEGENNGMVANDETGKCNN